MKEKIKALFKEYYNDETMPVVELEDKVLALFDVVELVCPVCKSRRIKQDTKWDDNECLNCNKIWAK